MKWRATCWSRSPRGSSTSQRSGWGGSRGRAAPRRALRRLNSSAPSRWDALADTLGGLSLPADFFPRADLYLDALAAANAGVNLVSFDPLRDGPAHVADSLQALRGLPGRIRTGIDVGTGGGFPGIPLALALPECRVVLLDGMETR